jgi:oligopeptide transport system substrate-binding protein
MRRQLAIALLAGAVISLLAIVTSVTRYDSRRETKTAEPAEPIRGGTLRVLSEPAINLDPSSIDEVYESVILRQIYQGLLSFDSGLRMLPCLATSWTISPDGTLYTFNLRHGVRFHDNSLVTAMDVAFTLERCLAPDLGDGQSLAATYLMPIRGAEAYNKGRATSVEGIRVIDDLKLEIELVRPCPLLLKVLAMDQTGVISRAAYIEGGQNQIQNHPVGTGPFRFVRRRPDRGIVLARSETYWGRPAEIDSLVFQSKSESTEAYEAHALLRGEVHLTTLSTGTAAKARELGLPIYRAPELSVSFLGLRLDLAPFDIPEVRRAVLLAIRRDPIRNVDPEGIVPVFGLLPPGLPGREPVDRLPRPDPAEARRLLAESGHPDGRGLPPITLGTSRGSAAVQKIAEGIQNDLQAIGLTVHVQRFSWRQLDSLTVSGKLQAFMMSWVADLPDPDAFLYPIFHSSGESNLFGYASPEVDSLLALGRMMTPGPERNNVYARLQDVIIRDAPMIPLYHSSSAYAWRAEVHGVEIGPSGFSMINFDRIYLDPPPLALNQKEAKR